MMDADRHRRLVELFAAAQERAPDEREAFLADACGGDEALLREVRELLAADEGTSPLFDRTLTHSGVRAGISDHTDDADLQRLQVGDSIGPYRILGVLGEGGMGIVYRAQETGDLKREVAVKVIRLGMDSRNVLARFESERQALALMDHPGVARVYNTGVAQSGQPYFAMELVSGATLTEFCATRELPLRERLELFIAVCNAVQHAHQKGVIHRDLKPTNVLVTEVDGVAAPKIIDFGIAKAVSGRLADSTLLTAEGAMIGTPEYMSPEQAQVGAADIDTRSDVYSLGIMLYELLTETLPFDAETLRAEGFLGAQRVIREMEPERPSRRVAATKRRTGARGSDSRGSGSRGARSRGTGSRGADARGRRSRAAGTGAAATGAPLARRLRGDLDWIVMRCLEKDRSRRYESAGELARDIRRHLNDEPIEAGPPTTGYRLRKFVRRHRTGVLVASLVGLVMVASVVGLNVLLLQALEARREAESQTAIAQAVNEFLRDDLLAAADPAERGRAVTVAEVLDVASEKAAARFGEQPRVELAIRETLGYTYDSLGQYDEALRELQRGYELALDEYGDEHEATLGIMLALTQTYAGRGESEQAEQWNLRGLAAAERMFGEDHGLTIGFKSSLALLYQDLRRYDDAERLELELLATRRRIYPPQHPSLLTSVNNLALLYQNMGRPEQAAPYMREAVELTEAAYGPDHPNTLKVRETLAWLYMSQNELASAETELRAVYEARLRVFGPDHSQTVGGMHSLGECLRRQERFEDAVVLLAQAEEAAHRAWPADGWAISAIQALYGDVLLASGRAAEAEPILVEAFERLERTVGVEHGLAQTILEKLVAALESSGRVAEAQAYRAKLVRAGEVGDAPGDG